MVNPKARDIDHIEGRDLESLIEERKKAAAHCLNLECQNEQLKVLIEKLHNLANQREDLFTKSQNPKVFSEDIDKLYLKSSSILDELESAKKGSKILEKTILELKRQILKLDKILSD